MEGLITSGPYLFGTNFLSRSSPFQMMHVSSDLSILSITPLPSPTSLSSSHTLISVVIYYLTVGSLHPLYFLRFLQASGLLSYSLFSYLSILILMVLNTTFIFIPKFMYLARICFWQISSDYTWISHVQLKLFCPQLFSRRPPPRCPASLLPPQNRILPSQKSLGIKLCTFLSPCVSLLTPARNLSGPQLIMLLITF